MRLSVRLSMHTADTPLSPVWDAALGDSPVIRIHLDRVRRMDTAGRPGPGTAGRGDLAEGSR